MMKRSIRPVFDLRFEESSDMVMSRLRRRLPECPNCTGIAVGRHVELFVPDEERHLWSPWLSVSAEAREDGCNLGARFGPHPNVWTWYIFCAFAVVFALMVGAVWGYAQWSLAQTPWAWALVPVALFAGAALFVASQIGQKLGADQMDRLRSALDELTRE